MYKWYIDKAQAPENGLASYTARGGEAKKLAVLWAKCRGYRILWNLPHFRCASNWSSCHKGRDRNFGSGNGLASAVTVVQHSF